MGQNNARLQDYNYSFLYLNHLKIDLLPMVSIQRNVETKMDFAASVSPRLLFCLPINSDSITEGRRMVFSQGGSGSRDRKVKQGRAA